MVTLSLTVGDDLVQVAKTHSNQPLESVGKRSFRNSLDEELNSGAAMRATAAYPGKKTTSGASESLMAKVLSSGANRPETSKVPLSQRTSQSPSDRDGLGVASQIDSQRQHRSQNHATKATEVGNADVFWQSFLRGKTTFIEKDSAQDRARMILETGDKNITSVDIADLGSAVVRSSKQAPQRWHKENYLEKNNKNLDYSPTLSEGTPSGWSQPTQSPKAPSSTEKTSKTSDIATLSVSTPVGTNQFLPVSATVNESFITQSGRTSTAQRADALKTSNRANVVTRLELVGSESSTSSGGKTNMSARAAINSHDSSIVESPSKVWSEQVQDVWNRELAGSNSVTAKVNVTASAGDQTAKPSATIRHLEPNRDADVNTTQAPLVGVDSDTQEKTRVNQEASSNHDAKSASPAVLEESSENGISASEHSSSVIMDEAADKTGDRFSTLRVHNNWTLNSPVESNPQNDFVTVALTNEENTKRGEANHDLHDPVAVDEDLSRPIRAGTQLSSDSKKAGRSTMSSDGSNFSAKYSGNTRETAKKEIEDSQTAVIQAGSERISTTVVPGNQTDYRSSTKSEGSAHLEKSGNGLGHVVDIEKKETNSDQSGRVVEVSSPDGAQGWLKVRAEIAGDTVHASIAPKSNADAVILHQQLRELNSYLQTERVPATVSILSHSAHGLTTSGHRSSSELNNDPQQETQRHSSDPKESAVDNKDHTAGKSNKEPTILDVKVLNHLGHEHSLSVLA